MGTEASRQCTEENLGIIPRAIREILEEYKDLDDQ